MTELYVNNFRGFRDTFIPIDKVNFLIGENSTGKTSILKLIRVLSDKRFWSNFDLNACGFHFGYFTELCDEDFFEIGFYSNDNFDFKIKYQNSTNISIDNIKSDLLNKKKYIKDLTWLTPTKIIGSEYVYDNYNLNFSINGEERDAFQLALNKFGQDSGLFDKIEVKILGDEQTSPLEIRIFFGENNIKISNVGYGVSQILPLIIEVLAKEKDMWYAIQQPEIHLHPRGQAAFGELIYDTQKADNKTFIIETHSDYIVDRFRLCVNKNKEETQDQFQVLFFERTNDGNQVTPIKIQSNGKYAADQPQSFQEFFIKEQLELIKI